MAEGFGVGGLAVFDSGCGSVLVDWPRAGGVSLDRVAQADRVDVFVVVGCYRFGPISRLAGDRACPTVICNGN